MSETIRIPRRVTYEAQVRLMRAEATVAVISDLYNRIARWFVARPAAKDVDALTIARAWLRASA